MTMAENEGDQTRNLATLASSGATVNLTHCNISVYAGDDAQPQTPFYGVLLKRRVMVPSIVVLLACAALYLSVPDKNKKQEILIDALRRRPPEDRRGLDYYLALYESNDDELIRQLQEIDIGFTPLTSNSAQTISSLMRKSEPMEQIWLWHCGITDELLGLMTTNIKGSRIRARKLFLVEDEWDVTCATLNSFLANFEVDELTMHAFPTDYPEVFPNFEEKLLKLNFEFARDDDLIEQLKKLCSAASVEVTNYYKFPSAIESKTYSWVSWR